MKELLTYSSLKTFRACKRKYLFQYEQGYRPARESEALFIGSLIHDAVATWLEGERNLGGALSCIQGKFDLSMNPDAYLREKCKALMVGYHNRYANEPYSVQAVEREFRHPLWNPTTMRESNLFELGGKLDAIYGLEERFILKEMKTTSDDISPESSYWDKLTLDPQVSGYYIGAESLGFKIESCIYDVIRKPTIKPYRATPIEDRKFKKDGTLYANQRIQDETVQEFADRLAADIAAQPDKYFARKEVPRLAEDLADYLSDVWEEAQVLHSRRKVGRYPRNPDACESNYGMCSFFEVCAKRASIEDKNLFKKVDKKHTELSQEAQGGTQ